MKTFLPIEESQAGPDTVWPSPAYNKQIRQLKAAVGREIYLAEINLSEVNLSVTIQSKSYELVAVVDFPRPDPANGLCPHMLVLSDGRGVNLGRIARISLNRSFQPASEDILFQEEKILKELVFCERRLSREEIRSISKAHLGAVLGKPPLPSQDAIGQEQVTRPCQILTDPAAKTN